MEITDLYKYKRLLYDEKKHTLTEGSPHKEILIIFEGLPYIIDIPNTDDKKEIAKLVNMIRGRLYYKFFLVVEHPKKRGIKPKPKQCLIKA